jgi:hypothetical protein
MKTNFAMNIAGLGRISWFWKWESVAAALLLSCHVLPTRGFVSSLPASRQSASWQDITRAIRLATVQRPPDFTVLDEENEADDRADDSNSNNLHPYTRPAEGLTSQLETLLEDNPRQEFQDDDSYDEEGDEDRINLRRSAAHAGRSMPPGASWMQRNRAFSGDYDESAERSPKEDRPVRTFRQDFRGTRVFVQGLPPKASWQDVKDHFREVIGKNSVVFASVSSDPATGESKRCGVVQFETTEMAATAIAIMRNYPMNGYQLFVREDIQESSSDARQFSNRSPVKKGPTPPSKWKCADETNAYSLLSEEDVKAVRSMIKARDDARRRRQYEASDNLRDELKYTYGVHLDDRLKMWWPSTDGTHVPKSIREQKGEGRWGAPRAWQQIPTTPENDACVNPDLVNALLRQRDIARKEKDFATADALLEEARTSPDGDLYLRIHDESRTWRIWTDEPPPRPFQQPLEVTDSNRRTKQTPAEQCIAIVEEHAPDRVGEIQLLLEKFQGREYQILKSLKKRYFE